MGSLTLPLPIHLRTQGAQGLAWREALAALPRPLSADPAGPHLVFAGPPEWLAEALGERLQGCQQVPAGPVTALGPLPAPEVLGELSQQGLSGWWPLLPEQPAPQLLACLDADQARWLREHRLRGELLKARAQLDERRWVDRAKGVLMQSRDLSEEEAFRLLRGAAMSAGLRVGEVSRGVTEAAQWAEAVNRAGRLRMLSQRVVKLAAQRLDGIDPRRSRQAQGMAIGLVDDHLSLLRALPLLGGPDAPAQAALQAVEQAWAPLKPLLSARLSAGALQQADAAAERLLQGAETLTEALEAGGARRALRLVNLCGRQRMRVQRLAKEAMLAALLNQPAREALLAPLMDDFEATLLELERAPLGGHAAREVLSAAREQWLHLLRGLRLSASHEGRQALAVASDALLELFDRLTADYEHSLQMVLS